MQLSKFSDFGLRILMQLTASNGQKVSVAQVARTFDISEHHVAKVASSLVRGGFVISGRGRSGGLRLAKEPSEISVGEVVRYLSGSTPVAECFSEKGKHCKALGQCGLRSPLLKAQAAFFEVLDEYSLNDLVKNRSAMLELLTTS